MLVAHRSAQVSLGFFISLSVSAGGIAGLSVCVSAAMLAVLAREAGSPSGPARPLNTISPRIRAGPGEKYTSTATRARAGSLAEDGRNINRVSPPAHPPGQVGHVTLLRAFNKTCIVQLILKYIFMISKLLLLCSLSVSAKVR